MPIQAKVLSTAQRFDSTTKPFCSVGIENRLTIADMKTEIGYWESDTVIGANHEGIVVTHVDKASKYLIAGLAQNKTMAQINRVTIKLFEEVKPADLKTMTFDNGREFCGHEKLSESLKLECFFPNPYHSRERGLNEHTNGLIRQFYPKSTNFKIVKEENFQKVVDLITDVTWKEQKVSEAERN